ncbi:hypothetical protein BaRGS_00030349, partial [Batillaria attramentaria]
KIIDDVRDIRDSLRRPVVATATGAAIPVTGLRWPFAATEDACMGSTVERQRVGIEVTISGRRIQSVCRTRWGGLIK